jgi:hypothetical protein
VLRLLASEVPWRGFNAKALTGSLVCLALGATLVFAGAAWNWQAGAAAGAAMALTALVSMIASSAWRSTSIAGTRRALALLPWWIAVTIAAIVAVPFLVIYAAIRGLLLAYGSYSG